MKLKMNSGSKEGDTTVGVLSKFGEVLEVIQKPTSVKAKPDTIMVNGAIRVIAARDFRFLNATKSILLWLVNPISPKGQMGDPGVIRNGTANGMWYLKSTPFLRPILRRKSLPTNSTTEIGMANQQKASDSRFMSVNFNCGS